MANANYPLSAAFIASLFGVDPTKIESIEVEDVDFSKFVKIKSPEPYEKLTIFIAKTLDFDKIKKTVLEYDISDIVDFICQDEEQMVKLLEQNTKNEMFYFAEKNFNTFYAISATVFGSKPLKAYKSGVGLKNSQDIDKRYLPFYEWGGNMANLLEIYGLNVNTK